MKLFLLAFITCFVAGCRQGDKHKQPANTISPTTQIIIKNYPALKDSISASRKMFAAMYPSLQSLRIKDNPAITDFWISGVAEDLYNSWKNTPWDFNGTATAPGKGAIACGYFVTTILRDMDCSINRNKLAVLPSSGIIKNLAPHQKIRNLSYSSYAAFNDSITKAGKGVYLVGLDFHVGFIVNDGLQNWFIHSNYIRRKGVTKELVAGSVALRSSKTRWLIP